MSSAAAGTAPPVKCSKCQKETDANDGGSDAAALCRDCKDSMDALPAAIRAATTTVTAAQQQSKSEKLIKMEIDTDLTTTETLDDLDELDDKLSQQTIGKQEASNTTKPVPRHSSVTTETPQLEVSPASPATIKTEDDTETEAAVTPKAATASDVKMAASSMELTPTGHAQQRATPAGKVTRNNLNGARSPTVLKRLRKSTRTTRFKSKLTGRGASAGGATNNGATNGHNGQNSVAATGGGKASGKAGGGGTGAASGARNRRTLFKRPAQKTPRVQACTRFVKSLFYKGSYIQIGDIVSIVDSEQNVYYAQIRGLLVDAYCEKSAFLTWLIPTQDSPDPKEGFDPATYLIGKSCRASNYPNETNSLLLVSLQVPTRSYRASCRTWSSSCTPRATITSTAPHRTPCPMRMST